MDGIRIFVENFYNPRFEYCSNFKTLFFPKKFRLLRKYFILNLNKDVDFLRNIKESTFKNFCKLKRFDWAEQNDTFIRTCIPGITKNIPRCQKINI